MSILIIVMMTAPMVGSAQACRWGRWGQPKEKIPVRFGGPSTLTPPEVNVYGKYQVGKGGIVTYPGPFGIVDISSSPPVPLVTGGTSVWTANYVVNIVSMKGILCYNVVMDFPAGTFEGCVVELGTFSFDGPYAELEDGFRYGVLRGTGEYKGWKLVISSEKTGGTSTWENYMYRPIP